MTVFGGVRMDVTRLVNAITVDACRFGAFIDAFALFAPLVWQGDTWVYKYIS